MYAYLMNIVLFYAWAMNGTNWRKKRGCYRAKVTRDMRRISLMQQTFRVVRYAMAPRVAVLHSAFMRLIYVSYPSWWYALLHFISFIFPSTFSILTCKLYQVSSQCIHLHTTWLKSNVNPRYSFISFGLDTASVDAFLNHPVPPQIDLLPQWYWRTWQLPQTRWGGRSFFPPKSLAFRTISCCPLLPRLLWACLITACIRRSRRWLNRKGSRVKVYLKMVLWERGARKLRGTQTAFIQ